MASDLVRAQKRLLLGEFSRLKGIHGRRWRKLLKTENPWHGTEAGFNAWRNARGGTAGNEVLRQLVSDMKKIEGQGDSVMDSQLSAKELKVIRKSAIKESLGNLRKGKSRPKRVVEPVNN